MIIGAQRSGTSSMFKYLSRHPDAIRSVRKETEYLTREYGRGLNWYRAHFPAQLRLELHQLVRRETPATFEATPDYLFHPLAARHAVEVVPEARFLVLLRDPVERAISHYHHMVRLGFETLALADALGAEEARLDGEVDRIAMDPTYGCGRFRNFSYVARGMYAMQLERWFACHERDRFLVLRTEDVFSDPVAHFARVTDFLQLRRWRPDKFRNYSYSGDVDRQRPFSGDAPQAVVDHLRAQFEQPNDALAEMLGWDAAW